MFPHKTFDCLKGLDAFILFFKNVFAVLLISKVLEYLGGIIGCKYKISSWHFNRFPDGNNIGTV